MKVVKLTRKYSQYGQWRYALQFGQDGHGPHYREHHQYVMAFSRVFGKHQQFVPGLVDEIWNCYEQNPRWQNDAIRARIYFNNMADLSAVLLVIDYNQDSEICF